MLLGLDKVHRFRFKNGAWRRVRFFPQVRIEIHPVSKFAHMAMRHDGKGFVADGDEQRAIDKALDDWRKTH